jgi:DNA-binding response OmpR family regulator
VRTILGVSLNLNRALSLAQVEQFELYPLDDWMPGLSGVTLCEQLPEFDSQTPILFYSGVTFEADMDRAFTWAAQCYLAQPADGGLFNCQSATTYNNTSGPAWCERVRITIPKMRQ